MGEIEKMNLESADIADERLAQMRELFPEVFSESGIDFEKLRLELGDEVDEGQERYAFTWPGKADAIRLSQTTSTATLRPNLEKSRSRTGEDGSFDSDNIYIEGDNLEVLKLLQRAYHGKVKMIYIDPPYNTGNDFVYHDSFENTIENYKEQAGLTGQSNADTSGRYHSNWCSMMYPRIRLARELLSSDGMLFISIDDIEQDNLKKICDEVFGESCFVAMAPRKTGAGSAASRSASVLRKLNDYVFIYVKTPGTSLRRLIKGEKQYPFSDEYGDYRLAQFNASGSDATRKARPNMWYPIYVTASGELALERTEATVEEIYPPDFNGMEGRWLWSPEKFAEDSSRYLVYENGKIRRKIYFDPDVDQTEYQVDRAWYDEYRNADGTKEVDALFQVKKVFDHPKPTALLERLIHLVDDDDYIALDYFSGSGSFAHAVMNANLRDGGKRKFIMVQLPECVESDTPAWRIGFTDLCGVGEERIRLAGDKIAREVADSNRQPRLDEEPKKLPDIGFRVFELDESGIEKPEEGQLLIDRVKPDRTDLDIIFEMMLKWGLELTYPVEQEEINGYPIYSVACDELICCMKPGLTVDTLEAIAERQPRRVFLLDSVIDDTVKLNALQIFKRVEERTQMKIDLRTV